MNDVYEGQLMLIEAAKQMSITAEEFIKVINQVLEVLKQYGNE